MSGRFIVKRELPVLWTILDTWTLTTEYVLFGEGVGNYVRAWLTDEARGNRAILLHEMVDRARREGIRHTLRLPSFFTEPLSAYESLGPANPSYFG